MVKMVRETQEQKEFWDNVVKAAKEIEKNSHYKKICYELLGKNYSTS